jgi:hypothetical protein
MRWFKSLNASSAVWPATCVFLALCLSQAQARSSGDSDLAYGRIPSQLFAVRPPHLFAHNVGLLTLQITNVGIIGNPFINDFRAGWRGGEYLYDSSLWVGGIGSDSEAHVSMSRYPTTFEFRPEADARWTIYESFEGVRGGVRAGAHNADDDGDGVADEDFQNGLDDDGDGRIDEDFAAIGQQMFSCQYRDDTPEAIAGEPDHFPLNILVRQRSFQWSTTGINEFVGLDFEIVNTGDQRLKELHIGFFSDSDAGPKTVDGYWLDDLVGWTHIDTTLIDRQVSGPCAGRELEIDAAFIWDAPDNGADIVGGDVPGIFGSLFLGHTTDDAGIRAPQTVGLTTVAWFSSSGEDSDPKDDDERYELLSRGTKPSRAALRPDDYRYVIAAGPFDRLNPGESLSFQTAYVIGDGEAGFRSNAVNAQRVFNGRYVDADGNEDTGVDGKERCLQIIEVGDVIVWDDPCDTLNTVIKFLNTPPCNIASTHYVDADCDPCTGIDGQETRVHWVGTTVPPPPRMNTDPEVRQPGVQAFASPAGDRKVILQWDNSSELQPDPITGDDIFEGYRIWRVDNWQRPEGSIGPAQEEWMKIAEFRRHPETADEHGAGSLYEPFPDGPVIRAVQPVDFTDDNPPRPIYPIGRYRYEDTNGILNGKLYFYAVTAVGIALVKNAITGEDEEVELSGLPSAEEAEAVVPRWGSVRGCDRVKVVPNPYRGGAAWDLTPSERDPTGTKIAFRNLPGDVSTLRVYTLSGDLVLETTHDGRDGDGTHFWDLITRNGQNVTSGVYLFSVQHAGGTCRGRFVVIR